MINVEMTLLDALKLAANILEIEVRKSEDNPDVKAIHRTARLRTLLTNIDRSILAETEGRPL